MGEPLSEIKKEEWTGAKYRLYSKPDDPKTAFADGDWTATVAEL